MRCRLLIGITSAALLLAPHSYASDTASQCVPLKAVHDKIVDEHHGRWIDLTDIQRAFLAGVYALNPNTPPGLPLGDKAAVGRLDDHAIVFFIDGDKACSPMPIPEELFKMVGDIGAGVVTHEGQDN